MKKKKKRKPAPTVGRAARAERYELFCCEYIKDQNAARAARAAGYSEHTAREQGCALLAKPHIKARVKKLLDEQKARVLLQADEILLGIKHLAVSDPRRLFDLKTGCVLPPAEWPDDIAQCVASFEVVETYEGFGKNKVWTGYLKKVRLWDKPKSQENLGRNQGLFTDIVKNDAKVTVVTVDETQVKDTLGKIEKDY